MNRASPSSASFAVLLALGACASPDAGAPRAVDARVDREAAPLDAASHELFGVAVRSGPAVDVAAVLAAPEQYTGEPVRIRGKVASVCKKAGCWTRLGNGESSLLVKMAGHAFYLPLDCEQRDAIAEGELSVVTRSVEELRHYEEDAGRHAEAAKITEPKREVVFVATGVALAKPAAK